MLIIVHYSSYEWNNVGDPLDLLPVLDDLEIGIVEHLDQYSSDVEGPNEAHHASEYLQECE
jgi:hypothetical protein